MVSYLFLIPGTTQDPTSMNLSWEVSLGLFLQHVLEAGHASCMGSDPVPRTSIYSVTSWVMDSSHTYLLAGARFQSS